MALNLMQRAQAEAIYMDHLRQKAEEAFLSFKNPPLDPQLRTLVDIELTAVDKNAILEKINNTIGPGLDNLEHALGRAISETTTVSLDVSHLQKGQDLYHQKLQTQGFKNVSLLESLPKSSIIPLQQELHFHLALAIKVYEKSLSRPDNSFSTLHQKTMSDINASVFNAYAKALKSATQDNTINLGQLNVLLDRARKPLVAKAHQLLAQGLKDRGVIPEQILKINKKKLKHLAEETPATNNDLLHLDQKLKLATLIGGNENTAHHRAPGVTADRAIATQKIDNNAIRATSSSRIQVRTPSLDVKKGLGQEEGIHDIAEKLKALSDKYMQFESQSPTPNAFVYNLYTSINSPFDGANKQTQGASWILQGAHQYNRQNKEPLCFVQNIPINGFGNALGYNSKDPVVKEATLMADMALLHTLSPFMTEETQSKIQTVFSAYQTFLEKTNLSLFSQSREGIEVIAAIERLKSESLTIKDNPSPNSLKETAAASLKTLFNNNLHHGHDFSKLTQTLSVFVSEASIGGCKSANERAQAINGRVAMLDHLQSAEQDPALTALSNALTSAAQQNAGAKAITQLKEALDTLYNERGLQAGASVISLVDQGASAKVEAKAGIAAYFNTNLAEESAAVMNALHQTKASAMQAHKGLTKFMIASFSPPQQSWLEKLSAFFKALFGVSSPQSAPKALIEPIQAPSPQDLSQDVGLSAAEMAEEIQPSRVRSNAFAERMMLSDIAARAESSINEVSTRYAELDARARANASAEVKGEAVPIEAVAHEASESISHLRQTNATDAKDSSTENEDSLSVHAPT